MAIESYKLDIYGRRCRVAYTLTDGRVINRGPFNVKNQADANSKAVAMQSDVLESTQKSDAQEAVNSNIKTSYKEATLKQVQDAETESTNKSLIALRDLLRECDVSIGIAAMDELSLTISGVDVAIGDTVSAQSLDALIGGAK